MGPGAAQVSFRLGRPLLSSTPALLLLPALMWFGTGGVLSTAIGPGGSPSAAAGPSIGVTITNPDVDPGWVPVIEWGVAAFDAHGIELPAVSITLRADLDSCGGNSGLFHYRTEPQIVICAPHKPSGEMVRSNRKLVVHELAHAWIDANVDDAARQRFMQLRQADNWNNKQRPHGSRGGEQAAEVLADAFVYGAEARSQQLCGFQVLTGKSAPLGPVEECG